MTYKEGIEHLVGATIQTVRWGSTPITHSTLFIETDLGRLEMFHERDCCNQGELIDGFGDLKQMEGEKVLFAECVKQDGVGGEVPGWSQGCDQWTFYKVRTMNTSATLRWFATSNGYYSVEVPCFWYPK